jgi:hypothetical protein
VIVGSNREYNPFEATTADINLRRTTGFVTPTLSPTTPNAPGAAESHLSPTSSQFPAAFSLKTTSAPIMTMPVTTDFFSRSLSNVASNQSHTSSGFSISSPGVKRKRNFKLGSKIDAWWSAVRTSFTAGTEDERERVRRRSDPSEQGGGALAPGRTSSTFTRPNDLSATTSPPLRNATSAASLSRPLDRLRLVPAGALAPSARVDMSSTSMGPPRLRERTMSASDTESETTRDTRRRNPQLSLNLGPSFNTMTKPKGLMPGATRPEANRARTTSSQLLTDSSSPTSASALSQSFYSPSLPPTSVSATPASLHGVTSIGPGFTPGFSPMWDQTPGLVPVSTAPEVRGLLRSAASQTPLSTKATASTFSMHTVRRHIKSRLTMAKDSCDKELRKIVQGITAHVEVELHKEAIGAAVPFDEGAFGDLVGDIDGPYGPYGAYSSTFDLDSESEALADVDAGEEAGHTDSDGGTSRPPSRSRDLSSPTLAPGGHLSRRLSVNNRARIDSPRRQSLAHRQRHLTGSSKGADLSTYSLGDSQALALSQSRSSANSSRSNSRSRSPLPPMDRNVSLGSRSPARSSKSHVPSAGLAQSSFILLLQDIITVATEILDTPISQLTSGAGGCAEYIQRVQQIGKAWDDNPELACRGWYVQLLLAVAGLSRVVEWWEAERGFWTFGDAEEDEDAEPILFVAKPTIEEPSMEFRAPMQTLSPVPMTELGSRSSSGGKYSLLGIDLGAHSRDPEDTAEPILSGQPSPTEDTAQQHAEELRQEVEEVRSQTLLMELSLDGQVFEYLSSAWQDLVG